MPAILNMLKYIAKRTLQDFVKKREAVSKTSEKKDSTAGSFLVIPSEKGLIWE
jgi:hypothetical protein